MYSVPHFAYIPELKNRIKSNTWGLGFGHCFQCSRFCKCAHFKREAQAVEDLKNVFKISNINTIIFFN